MSRATMGRPYKKMMKAGVGGLFPRRLFYGKQFFSSYFFIKCHLAKRFQLRYNIPANLHFEGDVSLG